MKRLISVIILVSALLPLMAAPIDEKADSAYAADNFKEAIALYTKAMSDEGTSAELFYNLGNAYYRTGDMGKAVLCYERALRLNPTDSKAKANLEFVNSKLVDKPGERGSFISVATDNFANEANTNTWAWIAFVLFAFFIGGATLYFFGNEIKWRKIGFFGGICLLILSVLTVMLAIRSHNISASREYAVITAPSTILSTVPRAPKNRNEEAMLLHQGTKVFINDSIVSKTDSAAVTWYEVNVDNEHRAWISSKDVEII